MRPNVSNLNDPTLLRSQSYVAGTWTAASSSKKFQVENPADGTIVGTVSTLSQSESVVTVDATQLAFENWSKILPHGRSAILYRWFALFLSHQEDLARIIVAEKGKPLAEARGEFEHAASFQEKVPELARRP